MAMDSRNSVRTRRFALYRDVYAPRYAGHWRVFTSKRIARWKLFSIIRLWLSFGAVVTTRHYGGRPCGLKVQVTKHRCGRVRFYKTVRLVPFSRWRPQT